MMKMSEQEFIEISEMVHEWRDIPEYEGLYRINEYGDVMSIGYGEKRLLKPGNNGHGYLFVNLHKNGTKRNYYIHRLVATCFCEGSGEFECVNHIDEDKTNNHYTNLEWCSKEYNNNYGSRNGNFKKKVICVEQNIIFNSISEAAEYVNGFRSNISACLAGRQKTYRGYTWIYAN